MLQQQEAFKLLSLNMISQYFLKFLGKKLKLKLQSNQSKNQKIIVQNLNWRIFFREQVKFLKSGIWFPFYNASNKDTFI